MPSLLQRVFRLFTALSVNPFELLKEHEPLRFWRSQKNGSVVSIHVPAQAGANLTLMLQRPIVYNDVKNGRLLSSAWTGVKKRGGKRQTAIILSVENAEALHLVLGKALNDARAKKRHAESLAQILTPFYLMMKAESRMNHNK